MEPHQQRKEENLRRSLQRTLVVVGVVGVLLLLGFDFWLRRLAEGSDPAHAMRMVGLAATVIRLAAALVAALLGRYLLDWARQTRDQGQWPPAGLEWPGNPPLRRGADAQRIAQRLRLAGVTVVALALLLAAWSAWMALA